MYDRVPAAPNPSCPAPDRRAQRQRAPAPCHGRHGCQETAEPGFRGGGLGFTMAKFVLAGRADCPYYAKAELLADYLQKNLPDFRIHKITQHPHVWEVSLYNTCPCTVDILILINSSYQSQNIIYALSPNTQ